MAKHVPDNNVGMEIYFDESGNFRPSESGLSAVMGVVVPENEAATLQSDFSTMVGKLPKDTFVDGEPKGYRMSAKQCRLLAELLNSHPGVKLVPVTVNTASIDKSFFDEFPPKLKELLAGESEKCLYETLQSEVSELARRCGNLSPDQLVRLLAYTVGLLRAINAVSTFYHCPKYHPYYDPMRMVFDKTGTPNSREELVFKQIVFMWLSRMTGREPITKIIEIHTENHPWRLLYEVSLGDRKGLDLTKILRGNLHFADSKQTWQLQLADMLASAWLNSLRDYRNTLGYAPVFRSLNRNTSLSNDQPVGMIGVAEFYSSQVAAPVHFDIFRQMVAGDAKLLPCGWEER